ncbi:Fur family transcriptional regulator [Cochlodiniinecator piscidefendens]|uniref:Fur family transcriptional regulator n=1 Tax=Cochlodiniinecator piscidefendens TaxID=2715756 RepID=UPI001409A544|nr:Fur family transcriptional regulator [Cochlodiniinecator piscidefendens]
MSEPKQMSAFSRHDHGTCVAGAMRNAENVAAQKGLRLTPVRRRALELLLEAHKALGAYEVLDRLKEDGFGSQPPVAYRALEFLVEHGFAHRIRRLNAFAACMHPDHAHRPVFFICGSCSTVAESMEVAVQDSVSKEAGKLGFVVERMNLEVLGTCPSCQGATA